MNGSCAPDLGLPQFGSRISPMGMVENEEVPAGAAQGLSEGVYPFRNEPNYRQP